MFHVAARFLAVIAAFLRAIAVAAAHALSPPACACCGARVSGTSVFCAPCAQTVVRAPSPDLPGGAAMSTPDAEPAVVAFALFTGAVADVIRRFKYGDRPDLARPLGHLLRRAARGAGVRADVVIPVPLHPRRLAERGYNQAALLAGQVAAELAAPLEARALRRLRNTAQQARLARALRLENVAGAFRVRDPASVRGRAVVLIDDVATTGATLAACRDALLGAGAASVIFMVVACAESASAGAARSPPPSARRT
jgi:ComF family protein